MKINEAIKWSIKTLKDENIQTAQLDTIIILEYILHKNRTFVLSNPDFILDNKTKKAFIEFVNLRKKRYPIAYITKHREFYGFDFYIDERVLVPRPETELIIDTVIKYAKLFNKPKIIDVATGSGIIAISLSKILNQNIFATDLSCEALEVAQLNAKTLKCHVDFVCNNSLDSINTKFDVIVSNPPYVEENEYEALSKDVKYEPKIALINNKNQSLILDILKQCMHKTHFLILELGIKQLNDIKHNKNLIEIINDYQNLPRIAILEFNH